MEVTYRDAGPADASALARIGAETFTQTFGHLYRPQDLAAFLAGDHSEAAAARLLAAPGTATRFAESGLGPVGYAVIAPPGLPHLDPARRAAELKRLYLLPPALGRGVGDRLMDWALTRARAEGAEDLCLSVFSDNHRAQAFYRRHGFTHRGEYHFRVGEQLDDEFVWVRPL